MTRVSQERGSHSVGVTRQYCGQVGKQGTGLQSASRLATEQASLAVRYQLYLPEVWANDPERRRKKQEFPEDVRIPDQTGDSTGTVSFAAG